jgi:sodium transport system permease protein
MGARYLGGGLVICWPDVWLLYRRELRSAVRERNIVVNSILLPVFLYPLLLWLVYSGMTFVTGQTEEYVSRAMLQGLAASQTPLLEALRKNEQIEIVNVVDPVAAVKDGKLDVLVQLAAPGEGAAAPAGDFTARITYDDSKDRSGIARARVADAIRRYRDNYLQAQAAQLGIAPAELQEFRISSSNLATSRQMGGFILGLMLPLFLIIMLAIGCIYPAIDATAGEREKSTWETLMTSATARDNIVLAKYLYVASMTSAAGILNVTAMLVSARSVLAPILGERTGEFSFGIPLAAVPLILVVTVLLALFIAAGMMLLASFARTFREGQSLVSPLYIAIFLPALLLQFPGIRFTPVLALIPVVNVVMVFRQAIGGTYQWPLIGITLAVEVACIVLALRAATKVLKYEDFLIGSYSGSFGKFLRQRILKR